MCRGRAAALESAADRAATPSIRRGRASPSRRVELRCWRRQGAQRAPRVQEEILEGEGIEVRRDGGMGERERRERGKNNKKI